MSRRKDETLPTPTHVGLTTCGHGDPDLDVQQHIIRPEVPPREYTAWDGSRTWTTYAVLCNQSVQNPILTPLADAPDGVKWCPICVGRYLQRTGKLGAAMKRMARQA